MKRPSKLRTKIALAGGVAALAGTGLFAAVDVANATTPPPSSQSVQVSDSGRATAGSPAPSSIPATLGLPKGGSAVNGIPVLPNLPGSVRVTSGSASSAADSAPAQTSGGSGGAGS